MRLKTLLFSMLLLTGFGMARAEIVEIGTEFNQVAESGLPMSGYWEYSISQTLYSHFEIGAARTITSISYRSMDTGVLTRSLDIYITPTSERTFSSSSPFVDVLAEQKVFSGDVTFQPDSWTTITFDVPFEYDGSKNLLITVDDNTGLAVTPYSMALAGTDIDFTLAQFNSTVDYDPLNLAAETPIITPKRPLIRFNDEERTIGLPILSSYPTNIWYNYSISEQVYRASQIGRTGLINSISFFYANAEGWEASRDLDVYLVAADKDFTSSTDWLPAYDSEKYFSGTVKFKYGWVTIKLDRPFKYEGTTSLAVIVNDRTGDYSGPRYFLGFHDPSFPFYESIYSYTDDNPFDPSSLSSVSGQYSSYRNQIRFEFDDADFIGDLSSETSNRLPLDGYYYRSLTQQIYTKEELGNNAKDLTSISFLNTGRELGKNVSIYLVPTYATEFVNGNSWIPFNESNRVFSGDVTFYDSDWTTIPFDQPFSYNGKTNLAVVMAVNSATNYSSVPFSSFTATGMGLYAYSDDVNTYPTSESLTSIEGDISTRKNQIKLNAVDNDLERPTDLEFDNVKPYSADVTWSGSGSLWEVQYKSLGAGATWVNIGVVDEQTVSLTDLVSNTNYYVRVRIIREDGSVSKWTGRVFMTELPYPYDIAVTPTPNSATIDWEGYGQEYDVMLCNTANYNPILFDDFENGFDEKGWTMVKDGEGPSTSAWDIYSENELYYTYNFSGDYSPASYSWTRDGNMAYHADNWLITPLVDLKGTLSFWQYVGNNAGDYLDSYEVKLSTSGNALSDFVYTLRPMAPGEAGWREMRFDLSPYEGEKGYIAIHHKDYDQIELRIDNFCIFTGDMRYIHTDVPTVTFEGLQPDTEYKYTIYNHRANEVAVDAFGEFATLPVNPAPYDIVAEPGVTSVDLSWKGFSDSYKVMYRTPAVIEETSIFFDDFESGDLSAKGWTIYTKGEAVLENGWMPYHTNFYAHAGKGVAISQSYYKEDGEPSQALDADNWLVTPQLDLKGTLKFWEEAYDPLYPDQFEVLLSTTGNEIADFTTVLRPMQASSADWNEVVIDLSAYEGQQGYIAIHHKDKDNFWLAIDDFGLYAINVITPAGEFSEIETTETYATIEGLDRETEYEVLIIGSKAGEEDAASRFVSFTTIVPADIVLYTDQDNSSTIVANKDQYANVTIEGRTIKKDGKWYSICLPFDLELEGSILEGADLRQPEDAKEVDTYLIIDCLTPLTKIEAGKPYMIKFEAGEDIVNPVFKEVKISDVTDYILLYGNKVLFSSMFTPGYSTMDDSYIMDGNIRLGRQNLQKDDAVLAFDCVFMIDSSLNSGLDGIGLNFGDMSIIDIITGVDKVKTADEPTIIYNVAGQRLGKAQQGVNIVGDKKVLVK